MNRISPLRPPTFFSDRSTNDHALDPLESPSKRQRLIDPAEEGSKFGMENLTSSESPLLREQTPIEASFRAFLSSFPDVEVEAPKNIGRKLPPPMKRGLQVKMTIDQRIQRLPRDIEPEQLTFIQAAHTATKLIGHLKLVGSGTFSNVYAEQETDTVRKVFKEDSSTGSNCHPLQGTGRLYKLAVACKKQYLQIREAYENGKFPIDALPILNCDEWLHEGFIRQPLVTKMFQPTWNDFVAKINTHGKRAQISDEEEALLRTIQAVFKRSCELKLCIDFKPDNLGYFMTSESPEQERVVIIDTFGLSGSEDTDVIPMNRANMKEFSKGNPIIHAFLTQAMDAIKA